MKKVLIVSYYWPPAGGPGVQRWLKFAKYLPDFNIQPVVYVPKNPNYPILDTQLKNEVSNAVIVLKNKINEPYGLARLFSKTHTQNISSGLIQSKSKESFLEKLLLFIRGNFFIPDARVSWVKPSVSYLKKYLLENQIDTIITTGPPHSMHLIGLKLSETIKNLKWIADFRDPWTTIGYHKSLKLTTFAAKKHKKLEQKVLNSAWKIIVTSPTTKKEFQPLTNKPIEVITNGFDSDFTNTTTLDNFFSLAHIGSFLSERNPEILWQSLRELIQENNDFAKDFRLKLIGKVSPEIIHSIEKFSLTKNLILKGYLPHNIAVQEQLKSQLLLLIEVDSEETKGIIAGKIFEYLASKRPIIAIGPVKADIETILKETSAGVFFTYKQKEELKNHLLLQYKMFKNSTISANSENINKYHRKNLTKKLASIILS